MIAARRPYADPTVNTLGQMFAPAVELRMARKSFGNLAVVDPNDLTVEHGSC